MPGLESCYSRPSKRWRNGTPLLPLAAQSSSFEQPCSTERGDLSGTYFDGSRTRPWKRIAPVGLCRMKNRNGRSTTSGGGGSEVVPTPMPVAAAAVVPFSSTAMIALWMTF